MKIHQSRIKKAKFLKEIDLILEIYRKFQK